jgi:large subunit ribosomal protein L27
VAVAESTGAPRAKSGPKKAIEAPAKAPKAKKEPKAASTKDDLKKIEGVGPKIETLLNEAGILTFADLSKTSAAKVKGILDAAGSRYKMHDPTTWAKQSKLAAAGDWDTLAKLQDELKGGK